MKHWNAIAARRAAGVRHRPYIETYGAIAADWADGFTTAMDMRGEAWSTMFSDRRTEQLVLPILALAGEEIYETFTLDARKSAVTDLPLTLQKIDAYWRSPKPSRSVPVRPGPHNKVGRNDPCPCGSGAKYKKCCGSSSSSSVH